ncbi:MAG TPA: hypothetical protein VFK22_07615 [Candidatus Dormibacteraeota bacterium]|nr:hypothetical protein [Candidatus Dormibacteraeota bacterium]
MAPKNRAQAGAGARKGKTSRRPVRPKVGQGVPILPIVVASIVGLLAIGMIVWIIYLGRPQPSTNPSVAGIPCDQLEHSQVHYHTGLQIVYNGQVTDLPANAGIQTDSAGNEKCLYWLHVHQADRNVIHIEAPAAHTFTLGQFFAVWNQWSQANGDGARKLDATHVATFTAGPDQKIVTYVDHGDGKGPQIYSGDPSSITLENHEVITIEITPPDVNPPPTFTFPSGL